METNENTEMSRRPGDCGGCGAEYPHCDCWRYDPEAIEAEADAREGMYTAWELLG